MLKGFIAILIAGIAAAEYCYKDSAPSISSEQEFRRCLMQKVADTVNSDLDFSKKITIDKMTTETFKMEVQEEISDYNDGDKFAFKYAFRQKSSRTNITIDAGFSASIAEVGPKLIWLSLGMICKKQDNCLTSCFSKALSCKSTDSTCKLEIPDEKNPAKTEDINKKYCKKVSKLANKALQKNSVELISRYFE